MEGEKDDLSDYLELGQKIPTNEKIYFGIGVLANTIIAGVVTLYLLDYYINIVKISYDLFIIANILYLLWNTINDVIFGYYGDRTRTKIGRRMPYIRYGAPFFALAFILFWFPFPGTAPGDLNSGQLFKFGQLVFGYIFFDTALTLVILSFVSLPPEMTESTKERNLISGYRTIFTLIGGITILFVPFILSLGLDSFRIFIVILGVFCMFAYVILSFKIKERKELYELSEQSKSESLIKEIAQSFKNKAFISFIVYNFAVIFATTMVVSFTPLFINIFGVNAGINSTIILIAIYSGNLLTVPIFLYFGKKIESRTIIIDTSLVCLFGIFFLFLIDFIFGLIELYWLIFALNGVLLGLGIFYYPFMSDAIDIDELNTDRRREAMHFGLNALLTKPAENLPAIIGASILMITGFIQSEIIIPQPASAIFGLKFMITVIPMVLSIILILSQLINPLKGDYLRDIKTQVLKLHEAKKNKKDNV
ncbi:MAG: MFS transporter [Promethearchaeota archaeon]